MWRPYKLAGDRPIDVPVHARVTWKRPRPGARRPNGPSPCPIDFTLPARLPLTEREAGKLSPDSAVCAYAALAAYESVLAGTMHVVVIETEVSAL